VTADEKALVALVLDVNQQIRRIRADRSGPLAEVIPDQQLMNVELHALALETRSDDLIAAGNLADGVRLGLQAGAIRTAAKMLRRPDRLEVDPW
jgi:hypothetical protein